MRLDKKRLGIVILALLAALPSFGAQRKRSVGKPNVGVAFTASCKGTVVDAATGLPVAFATVSAGESFRVVTSREGKFQLSSVTALGSVAVTAGRTGYKSSTQMISGDGTHELTFRLQSRPTVNLKKTDGTTLTLDDDSVKFGYVVVFGGYVAGTEDDFCKTDGTRVTIPLASIKKVVGPAVLGQTACCTRMAQKILLELRDGTSSDYTFRDSCEGTKIDLLGRNHVTGDSVFVPFSEVAELVFP